MVRWLSLSIPLALGLVLAGLLSLAIPDVPTAAALTRESALEAWEEVQQSDPQVTAFEKLGDRRYHFATERFPYDGDLQVVNVAIDDLGPDPEEAFGNRIAIVEVELVDMSDEIHRRHIQSIGLWERNNTLYFDKETKSWLSFSEWQQTFTDSYAPFGWISCFTWSSWGWLFPLVLLAAVVAGVARKATRQIDRTMSAQDRILQDHERAVKRQEEAIQLTKEAVVSSQQTNQLLGEILEELRKSA